MCHDRKKFVNTGPRADHRTVLALFSLDGLSHREIAETLGIPEGTVWSRLHLARKKLTAELKTLGFDMST
jgi:DNA-directed RNA polymerase specialized sigma24 family protein